MCSVDNKGKWRQEENIAFIFALFNESESLRYILTYRHTCKKREISEIYLRKFFWIFRKILG